MIERPYIICHMVLSLDGKVTGAYLLRHAAKQAAEVYYEINRSREAQAFACGRTTMEESFTHGWQPCLTPYAKVEIPRGDFIARTDSPRYAICFDRKGRVGWQSAEVNDEDPGYNGSHIIEVVTDQAPSAYLAYLRHIGVSYIIAGKTDLNLSLALRKLTNIFNIQQLLLEGGSEINGAFEREGMIDELSLVLAPVVAEGGDKPLFYESRAMDFNLESAQTYENCLHLLYKRR